MFDGFNGSLASAAAGQWAGGGVNFEPFEGTERFSEKRVNPLFSGSLLYWSVNPR
jgi:hypothetical protein